MVGRAPRRQITLAGQYNGLLVFWRARLDTEGQLRAAIEKAEVKMRRNGWVPRGHEGQIEFWTSHQSAREVLREMGHAELSDTTEGLDSDEEASKARKHPEKARARLERLGRHQAEGRVLLVTGEGQGAGVGEGDTRQMPAQDGVPGGPLGREAVATAAVPRVGAASPDQAGLSRGTGRRRRGQGHTQGARAMDREQ